jgi:hypothetical protein
MKGKTSAGISRREFARRAAVVSAVASLGPTSVLHAGPSAPTEQTQQPPNMPKLSAGSQGEAEARVHVVLAQYGSRLTEDQQTDIRRLCVVAQPPLDHLRAYAVENGDGPALYLKPLVEREKKPAVKPAAPLPRLASPNATPPPAAKAPAATPDAAKKPSGPIG